VRIVITGADTEAELTAALDRYFDTHLGPVIAADAKRYAPKRTGTLAGSVTFRVEDHKLIVEATAPYSAYVEMGHRVAHGPGMKTVGPKVVPPQPFLRSALFTVRD
jgi:hypothetical protein